MKTILIFSLLRPGDSRRDDIPDEQQPPVALRSAVQCCRFPPDEVVPGWPHWSPHDRDGRPRLSPPASQPGQPLQSRQQHPGLAPGSGRPGGLQLPGGVLQLRAHVQQLLRQAGPGHGRQPPVLQVRNYQTLWAGSQGLNMSAFVTRCHSVSDAFGTSCRRSNNY